MSRPSHAVPDFRAPNGLILHSDHTGQYHNGPSLNCERCRLDYFKRKHAIAAHAETVKNAEAVKPRMNASEAETVRRVNDLLSSSRKKSPSGWWLVLGVVSALSIWALAIVGAISLFH